MFSAPRYRPDSPCAALVAGHAGRGAGPAVPVIEPPAGGEASAAGQFSGCCVLHGARGASRQRDVIEPATYNYLHQDAVRPFRSKNVWAPYNETRRPGRLLEPLADQLPRQPLDRGHRRAVRQRRHGQARHLPHRRAAAHQGRRLRAGRHQDEGRASPRSKRRCASRTSSSGSTRSSTRPRSARVKGVIRDLYAEKGYNDVERRRRELDDAARRAQARAPDLHHRPKGRSPRSAKSSSTATRRSATASCAAR